MTIWSRYVRIRPPDTSRIGRYPEWGPPIRISASGSPEARKHPSIGRGPERGGPGGVPSLRSPDGTCPTCFGPLAPSQGTQYKGGVSYLESEQNALTRRVGHPRMSVGQDSLGVCPEDTYLGVLCPIYRDPVECTHECIRPKISLTPGEIWPLFCGTTVSPGTRWTRRGLKTSAQKWSSPRFLLRNWVLS